MKALRSEAGQFIPISMMVTFTTVVFLVAVVNVSKVAQAKLKVQNLADAVALNLASQMASSLNKVADLNEYMNRIEAPVAGTAVQPGDAPDCQHINPSLPPISCAENDNADSSLNQFNSKGDAVAYSGLIQTVNATQQLFIDAYNNFIGAGTSASVGIGARSSLQSILYGDFTDSNGVCELTQPGTIVIVWNDQSGEANAAMTAQQAVQASKNSLPGHPPAAVLDTSNMQSLKFKTNDMTVTFKTTIPVLNIPGRSLAMTLSSLHTGQNNSSPIGWMEPDTGPQINVQPGGAKPRTGAGAIVIRTVSVPILGNITVKAEAQAYVVLGSGMTGTLVADRANPAISRPVFKPTYWVKLAGPSS